MIKVSIAENLEEVEKRISAAAKRSGRKREDITLVAVTKTHPAEMMNEAIKLGVTDIGENKPQEVRDKYDSVLPVKWHLIGHLQTNKVRQIVDKVDLIQSVDSLKLASEISKQSLKIGKKTDVLVEVNIGREENKSGVVPEQLDELLCQIADLEGISVKGLMSIPPICDNTHKISKYFDNMRNIFIDISSKKLDNISMTILSMGMSADYYEAILEGATMVRVGSSLFGARDYSK